MKEINISWSSAFKIAFASVLMWVVAGACGGFWIAVMAS